MRALATGAGLALAATTVTLVATPAHAAPVSLTLLTVNDFHGRIDANTTKWATTIETIRAAKGDGNTMLVGAGDNIGASLFASAYAEDEPTVKVLNAMDMATTATGNHEFDRGFAWLKSHVIDGTGGYTKADFPILGDNVVDKTSGDAAMQESYRATVAGLDVCVVGAVTQETPTLVSPDGVANLTFKAPVAEVNRVAAAMDAADPCDVTVASYHEGAPEGDVEGKTLDDEMAASPVFKDIVDNTSPLVDVIVTGHTHKKYSWSAPVPGQSGVTRPVIQAGNYGEFVGEVDLTVDNGVVTAHTEKTVPRAATADTATYPRVAAVKSIVDQATAAADVVGNKKVGEITADVTTAYTGGTYGPDGYTGGTRDDRGSESTMGHLVADALRNTPIAGQPTPDIGVTNPGGLRAELFHAGDISTSPENTDGVVTFEEANSVLPFVNNVSYVDVTGATFKQILEQQWQRDAAGAIPSRGYLALGLSKNVKVRVDHADDRTLDGSHVTSVTVNGKPLDMAKTYKVATFSFLAAGGDNFRAFKGGKATDTGKVDRDLWIDGFFAKGAAKSPDFARRQVFTDAPSKVVGGSPVTIHLTKLDLTSLGTKANTSVAASLLQPGVAPRALGDFPVTGGSATVDLTMPQRVAQGSTLLLTTDATGTRIPIQAVPSPKAAVQMTAAMAPRHPVVHRSHPRVSVEVTSGGAPMSGVVKVITEGRTYRATLEDGKALLRLAPFNRVGTHKVQVKYLGDFQTKSASEVLTVVVHRR